MMDRGLSRREALVRASSGVLAGAALLTAGCAAQGPSASMTASGERPPARSGRRRVARVAHLTDSHVQPERRAAEGFAACLAHVNGLRDRPSAIITGGDLIMDGFEHDEARTRLQWELFTKALRDGWGGGVHHCLGNHDIWGWNKGKSRTTGAEPKWGKLWAVEQLGLPDRYHGFDIGLWRVIVLDSTHPDPENPDGYIALLDEAQHDWLTRELAAIDPRRPVMIVSHIPIASAVSLFPWANKDNNFAADKLVQLKRELSPSWTHVDAHRLRMLFRRHPNVRLCLGGHLHRTDRVDYEGVTYLCNGAVSGSWWNGANDLTREGYAVIDLYDDGTFEREYVEYGWVAEG